MDFTSIESYGGILLVAAGFSMLLGIVSKQSDWKLYALWFLGLAILINTSQILAKLP